MLIAPLVSRMLRFFPPVVTGTIILVIGVSLMRIGINWIFGNPFGPTAPQIVNPEHAAWLQAVTEGITSARRDRFAGSSGGRAWRRGSTTRPMRLCQASVSRLSCWWRSSPLPNSARALSPTSPCFSASSSVR